MKSHFELILENDLELLRAEDDYKKEMRDLDDQNSRQNQTAAMKPLKYEGLRNTEEDAREIENNREAAQQSYNNQIREIEQKKEKRYQTRYQEIIEENPHLYKEHQEIVKSRGRALEKKFQENKKDITKRPQKPNNTPPKGNDPNPSSPAQESNNEKVMSREQKQKELMKSILEQKKDFENERKLGRDR